MSSIWTTGMAQYYFPGSTVKYTQKIINMNLNYKTGHWTKIILYFVDLDQDLDK